MITDSIKQRFRNIVPKAVPKAFIPGKKYVFRKELVKSTIIGNCSWPDLIDGMPVEIVDSTSGICGLYRVHVSWCEEVR